jgi:ABC-type phosphate transport system substrate-binding protein
MKSLSARGLMPACLISAAAVAALAAPGTALAGGGKVGEQCSGSNIKGQGSSLQKIAQQKVWNVEFNNDGTAKKACSGKYGDKLKPTVEYESTGSGAGLISWGAEESKSENETSKKANPTNFAATNAYIGTDEPPNPTQIKNIESWESTPNSESVETIPVLQGAVAIIVHLPENCTEATSKGAAGRLVLNESTLQGIYDGTITKWSEVKDDGDELKGAGCTPSTDTIKPVVRLDQSGTTHIFKRFLGLINSTTETYEGPAAETETLNWGEASEGKPNLFWPAKAHVVRSTKSGGGGLVSFVAEEPNVGEKKPGCQGCIGYANLADARANGEFSNTGVGGAKTSKFWVELENSSKTTGSGKTLKTTYTYADPSSDKDVEAAAKANCASTDYIEAEGGGTFPPASVYAAWNTVTSALTSKTYALCGLSYDLAFSHYSLLPMTSEKEATTVQNFQAFVDEAAGGQKLIGENRDYLALPKGEVLKHAEAGVKEIGY